MTIARAGKAGLGLALAALAAGVGGLAAQTAAAPPRSMTLDQVVAAALEHSPQVVQGEGAVRNAAAAQKAAKGSFLPSVTLSTGASLLGANRVTGLGAGAGVPADATSVMQTSTSYNAGISASMDVFDGGKRMADLARTRATAAEADAGLLQQQYAATLAAKTDFFDVLRAGELVKAAQAEAERAGEGLKAAQDRLKAGAATRSDVLRAQLAQTQAQQALSQAQSQQTTAQYSLGRAVGYAGPVLPAGDISLAPRPLALSPAQLDSLVTTRAPAVQAAEAAARASSASVSAAKAAYLPQLSVGAGYDWTHNGQNASALNTTGALGGNASWDLRAAITLPVFDGFQRDQAVTQAKVAADAAQATLDDQRRGQRVELQKDLAALDNAQTQIALGEQAVQSAQEDLRVQQERYRLGASTMLDVTTSQTALAQAEQSLVNARYDYQVSRAAVEALAGRSL